MRWSENCSKLAKEKSVGIDTCVTERRMAYRYPLSFPIEAVNSPWWSGQTENLSSGGVLFTSSDELMVGERVEYNVALLPGAGVYLHCWGTVLRRHYRGEAHAFALTIERHEFLRRAPADVKPDARGNAA